jgi:hypothetical protein
MRPDRFEVGVVVSDLRSSGWSRPAAVGRGGFDVPEAAASDILARLGLGDSASFRVAGRFLSQKQLE